MYGSIPKENTMLAVNLNTSLQTRVETSFNTFYILQISTMSKIILEKSNFNHIHGVWDHKSTEKIQTLFLPSY